MPITKSQRELRRKNLVQYLWYLIRACVWRDES
ncbi:hypothetical protein LCGC14_1537930 [marine sediment metagenome]|uniref:Uncharacterized protein n=1 Tax=marine sediment metagenome TaxID=412755 RepID=A0A0F9IU06_9ZZZZ